MTTASASLGTIVVINENNDDDRLGKPASLGTFDDDDDNNITASYAPRRCVRRRHHCLTPLTLRSTERKPLKSFRPKILHREC